jgi:hypothetical protein
MEICVNSFNQSGIVLFKYIISKFDVRKLDILQLFRKPNIKSNRSRHGSEITQIQFYQWNHKATVWKADVKRHSNQIT